MSNIIKTNLQMVNGNNIRFEITPEMYSDLKVLVGLYNKFADYNEQRGFRESMIKTAISDIDLESKVGSSMVESVAAICCKKVKNKEQRSALNMIKLLEDGVLERYRGLSSKYIIEIWRALTFNNRNVQGSITNGFRKTSVKILKVGKTATQREVVYEAPKASKVNSLMEDLCSFYNNDSLVGDAFVNALLKAAIFSAYFVYVHPFLDGNGRTSRLLTNKLLVDHGLTKFRYISFTSELVKHKKEYGILLKEIEANSDGDFTKYVDNIIQWFGELFKRLVDRQSGIIDISMLNNRQKIMLNVIRGSAQGTHINHYKKTWNNIAKERGYEKIKVDGAASDLNKLMLEDLIKADERYVRYDGYRYFRS